MDIDERDTVLREASADPHEDPGVPLVVAHAAVDPDVLAAPHRNFLSYLLQEARLLVAHGACLLSVVADIALPLRHQALEVVRVDVHDVFQREDVVPGEPAHGVPLAGAHGTASEDNPGPVLWFGALGDPPHDLVLPLLPLEGVVRVVGVVQRPADFRKLAMHQSVKVHVILLREACACRCIHDIVRVAVGDVGGHFIIVVLWCRCVHHAAVVDGNLPEKRAPLHAMAELGKADLTTLVRVQVGKEPLNLDLRQRKPQLLHADLQELLGREGSAVISVDLLESPPQLRITELRDLLVQVVASDGAPGDPHTTAAAALAPRTHEGSQ
mmetsp:Transcript_26333/g.83396  ORF Transcript_26333/g.83396 Transcript_26333/m.83396 type:complete len:326 (-) Transcript_26333:277-1254(-)